jgi:hypothetical protein
MKRRGFCFWHISEWPFQQTMSAFGGIAEVTFEGCAVRF